jgi:hypothetical protein
MLRRDARLRVIPEKASPFAERPSQDRPSTMSSWLNSERSCSANSKSPPLSSAGRRCRALDSLTHAPVL